MHVRMIVIIAKTELLVSKKNVLLDALNALVVLLRNAQDAILMPITVAQLVLIALPDAQNAQLQHALSMHQKKKALLALMDAKLAAVDFSMNALCAKLGISKTLMEKFAKNATQTVIRALDQQWMTACNV